MTLVSELQQMKHNGKQVVSIDFILNRLRSPESHVEDKTRLISIAELEKLLDTFMAVK